MSKTLWLRTSTHQLVRLCGVDKEQLDECVIFMLERNSLEELDYVTENYVRDVTLSRMKTFEG